MKIPSAPAPDSSTLPLGLLTQNSQGFGSETSEHIRRPITKRLKLRRGSRRNSTRRPRRDSFRTNSISHVMKAQQSTERASGPSALLSSTRAPGSQIPAQPEPPASPQPQHLNSEFQRTLELSEYLGSIKEHMVVREPHHRPQPIYDCRRVSEQSRTRLVSWIFDVSSYFGFRLETAYLAVNIADKALGRRASELDKLAVLGITALFMATKYEEILIPNIANFVSVAPAAYGVTKQEILQLEGQLINLLDFDLSYVSPLVHLQYSSLVGPMPDFVKARSRALIKELTLHAESHYLLPSQIAASAISLAEQQLASLNQQTLSTGRHSGV